MDPANAAMVLANAAMALANVPLVAANVLLDPYQCSVASSPNVSVIDDEPGKIDRVTQRLAAMSKPKQAVAVSAKRARTGIAGTPKKSRSRQELIDERVISESDDDSAWEVSIEVKRRGTSFGLPANLAQRAAFLGRLHREQDVGAWLERIVRERVELEERAFGEARRQLGAKRNA
jgi:hypothetical protein